MASRNNLFFFIIIISFFFFDSTMETEDFNLDFASFSSFRNLTLLGDSYLRNGVVGLTKELGVPSSSSGSVICTSPVPFFDSETNISASFSTRFSFSIKNMGNPSSYGDGLAFFVSPNNSSLGSSGGYLGLGHSTSSSSSSQFTNNKFFAIEFDTRLDPFFSDPNDNHIGLDINSLISIKTVDVASRGIDLKSGNSITAWIDYDNHLKILKVWMSYSSFKPENPVLSADIDLSLHFQDFMYVGFSASTKGSTEVHVIQDWRFQTSGFQSKLRRSTHPHNVSDNSVTSSTLVTPISSSSNKLSLSLGIACPAFLCLAVAVFGWFSIRKNRTNTSETHDFLSDFTYDLRPFLLSKLSVKSLVTLKCVSKSGLSMIQNLVFLVEPFCWETADIGTSHAFILSVQSDGSNPEINNWIDFGCTLRRIKHSRGLIAFYDNAHRLFLTNLTTGEWRYIPTINLQPFHEFFELGYDSSSKKYKILVWRENVSTGFRITDVHICSLGDVRLWKRIRETPRFIALSDNISCNVNGKIFWLDVGRLQIISFDLCNEIFGTFNLPVDELYVEDYQYSIFEVEGQLALVKMPNKRGLCVILKLWVLSIVSDQWISILLNPIALQGINLQDDYLSDKASFLGRNGEVLIIVSDMDDLFVYVYNLVSCQVTLIIARAAGLGIVSVQNHLPNNIMITEWGEAPPSLWQ